MGKMNNILKFFFLFVNTLVFLISATLLGVSIWAMTSFWSDLDSGTFQSVGIMLIVSSSILSVFVCIGCLGSVYQTVRKGHCQGRKLLGTYQVILIAILLMQFYLTVFSLNTTVALDEVQHDLHTATNSTVEYVHIENHLYPRFNDYYFDTLDSQDGKHSWFWDFVDDNCPDGMGTSDCNAVGLANSCPDETACDAANDEEDFGDCPYDMCRKAATEKVVEYLEPVGEYGIFVFLVQFVMLLLTCALTCFNPRDTDAEILTKSGTIAAGMVLRRASEKKAAAPTTELKRKTRRLSAAATVV